MGTKFGEGPIDIKPAPEEAPKKRRIRKMTGSGPLEIPLDMFPDGIDLMWVSDSILGQPSPEIRQQFEINAWEPVSQDMFDGRFDGMFMRRGQRGEINVQGMVLMWRPMELTAEARAEERAAALAATRTTESSIKRGEVPGISEEATQHHRARANTRVVRTFERGDIPQ
jgi:hypothetical protein